MLDPGRKPLIRCSFTVEVKPDVDFLGSLDVSIRQDPLLIPLSIPMHLDPYRLQLIPILPLPRLKSEYFQ